jgi:uncharacterized protein YrrD
MQFKENADVLAADGEKIGNVDRVVIDPRTKRITHIITKKGLLFRREKLIPLEMIESTSEERVALKSGVTVDDLPDFREELHIPAQNIIRDNGPAYARPLMWYPARAGVPTWGAAPYPGFTPQHPIEKTRNIPQDTTPLEEGARVLTADDQHVGDVERVYTDERGEHATHFLIAKGLVSKERKTIPAAWVDAVFTHAVHLSVDQNVVDNLPEHEE